MRAPIALLLLGTLCLPAAAATTRFPIDVDAQLNGLDIVVTSSPGDITVVLLENRSPGRVECRASFEGGFATPVRRVVRIAPGKVGTMSYALKDAIARLRVDLTCTPLPVEK